MSKKFKKFLGQNFLRNELLLQRIPEYVGVGSHSCVLEIGCGDGALTKSILDCAPKKLVVVEVDSYWLGVVKAKLKGKDDNVIFLHRPIQKFDLCAFKDDKPWNVIANIPYNITYTILQKLVEWKNFLGPSVLMVQEEVAQKLVKKGGRDYTPLSVQMQHHFDMELHDKVHPKDFEPAPKVFSRIIQLNPVNREPIYKEEEFWKFIKVIFSQPRRMISNNIAQYQDVYNVPVGYLKKRAQELSYPELVKLWNHISNY